MRLRRRRQPKGRYLEHCAPVRVRFNEVDSLQIVWHGHFYKYFEDGRFAFGERYGLSYLDILQAGYVAPVVHTSCDHFLPARFGAEILVATRLYEQESAKILYYYEITRVADAEFLAAGKTVQAFLDRDLNLVLTLPEFMRSFYQRWQDHWHIAAD